jgi:restriction system protein
MPTSRLVLIAVIVALTFGAAATLALRFGGRRRMAAAAGTRALAAMRWREFSQFVVTALSDSGASGGPADLLLRRDQRTWLLACRQSPDFRVTGKQVEEMGHAVRQRGAAGGVIATLGRIAPRLARTTERVELVDGRALWELIEPLLPAGLQDHVAEQVQRRQRRALLGAWLAALGLGIAVAFAFSLFGGGGAPPEATRPPAAAAPVGDPVDAPVRTADAPAIAPAAPAETITGDDDATRQAVLEAVNAVEGVDRSVWSTRSTLLVLLQPDAGDVRNGVCAALERYEALRASRVQLQPPQGSAAPVRFVQCRAY